MLFGGSLLSTLYPVQAWALSLFPSDVTLYMVYLKEWQRRFYAMSWYIPSWVLSVFIFPAWIGRLFCTPTGFRQIQIFRFSDPIIFETPDSILFFPVSLFFFTLSFLFLTNSESKWGQSSRCLRTQAITRLFSPALWPTSQPRPGPTQSCLLVSVYLQGDFVPSLHLAQCS